MTLINCAFYNNWAGAGGGGLDSGGDGVIMINCLFSGNSAPNAGAFGHSWGSAVVVNCTFVGNSAEYLMGGMGAGEAATIVNSVFWGNTDNGGDEQRAQIGYPGDYPPTIDYSCVQAWDGTLGGEGNVDVDPLFVDTDGPDDIVGTLDDNLRLSADSPLINAGDPDPFMVAAYDLDGHTRILCDRVDMGAYEFGIGDYDCDRVVDLTDFTAWEACMTGPSPTLAQAGGPVPSKGGGPIRTASRTYLRPSPVLTEGEPPLTETLDCQAFDFDADGDVDLQDFAGFQSVLSETAP